MTITTYGSTSPYALTPIVNELYLGPMVNISIPKLIDDVLWTVTQTYNWRPDLLAYDLYSDSRLWWIFAQRNPDVLMDPMFDLTTGAKIYLPKLSTLQQVLGI